MTNPIPVHSATDRALRHDNAATHIEVLAVHAPELLHVMREVAEYFDRLAELELEAPGRASISKAVRQILHDTNAIQLSIPFGHHAHYH